MVPWLVVAVLVVVLAVLLWWSLRLPDRGPDDELTKRFRKSGGWGGA